MRAAEPRTTRGGQRRYSPLAILTGLTLRAVFRLALRQAEGLIGSAIRLLGLDLAVPMWIGVGVWLTRSLGAGCGRRGCAWAPILSTSELMLSRVQAPSGRRRSHAKRPTAARRALSGRRRTASALSCLHRSLDERVRASMQATRRPACSTTAMAGRRGRADHPASRIHRLGRGVAGRTARCRSRRVPPGHRRARSRRTGRHRTPTRIRTRLMRFLASARPLTKRR